MPTRRNSNNAVSWFAALCVSCVLPACAAPFNDTDAGDAALPDGRADTANAVDAASDGIVANDGGDASVDAGTDADDSGADGADAMAACPPDAAPVSTSALRFDGVNDHVTMGVARTLGLQRFTVEAWVRRDGTGDAAGTGVGGVSLVPIAGKGRGEGDGSNVDCNYAFGFFGEVIAADFEDMATGANHPVIGRTAIRRGEWHHVAASYDGTTWRLYVDGREDARLAANAVPRQDSIQHFGIGTAFDSRGVAAGRLHGAVDEVRVWNRARTQAEIAGAMHQTITGASAGLVSRWGLDAGETTAGDTAGANPGTIAGAAMFVRPGAVLDLGAPPVIAMPSPAPGAEVTGTSVTLGVTIADPDSTALVTNFHVRQLTDTDDFTIVVMPDTQYYTEQGSALERYFYDQTRWIMANRAAYNIRAVIHNGDITDHGDRFEYEWTVADRAMRTLETALPGLPNGLPYGVAVGNHDLIQSAPGAGTTVFFNRYFGVARFDGRAYYGGHYAAGRNDDNWFTFSAGGLDFVVVSLTYDTVQDPAVLAWARAIFESHPGAFGILNSHFIVGSDAQFGAQGQAIYNGLRGVDNVHLMTNGHVSSEARRTDTYMGHVIHSMLADYQGRVDGGTGWMRIWEFSPANSELTVRTYSPTLNRWETDAQSEFTLPVNIGGAGGTFRALASVNPASVGTVSTSFAGLARGRRYEWYVTVGDCAHTITSPVYGFRTAP